MYVNGSEGLSEISLDAKYYRIGSPSVSLDAVSIDGEQMRNNEFPYQQNNLKINLKVRSFTSKGQLY